MEYEYIWMLGEDHTQVLKSSLSRFEKAKPSAYNCIKMSWPVSPSLHQYTTSCISSFCEPQSLKGALEQFVSSLQPAQCCGVVIGLLWLICVSCDLSPFPTPSSPCTNCATFAWGGWRGQWWSWSCVTEGGWHVLESCKFLALCKSWCREWFGFVDGNSL